MTVYTYNEAMQEKESEITWHLNSNDDNPFFAEDNRKLATCPDEDTFCYLLSLSITNEMLQKPGSGD